MTPLCDTAPKLPGHSHDTAPRTRHRSQATTPLPGRRDAAGCVIRPKRRGQPSLRSRIPHQIEMAHPSPRLSASRLCTRGPRPFSRAQVARRRASHADRDCAPRDSAHSCDFATQDAKSHPDFARGCASHPGPTPLLHIRLRRSPPPLPGWTTVESLHPATGWVGSGEHNGAVERATMRVAASAAVTV